MKSRFNLKTLLFSLALVAVLLISSGFGMSHQAHVSAQSADAYDISEYQGHINNQQAQGLKKEVSFVILRAQNGSAYQDRQFQNNTEKMDQNNVPYGVYSYSLYHNDRQARNEASALYNRAPNANFYVNDIEQNNAGSRLVSATNAWAKEMKQLTTKPVVLYSYQSFINQYFKRPTRKHYDAVWVASYSNQKPQTGYKYDLWQYTSRHYSKALGERLDASKLTGKKSLSFWLGQNGTDVVQPVKSVIKQTKAANKVSRKRAKLNSSSINISYHELRVYHHEMTKIGRKLRNGHYHMTKRERKALRIYQARHGHAYYL